MRTASRKNMKCKAKMFGGDAILLLKPLNASGIEDPGMLRKFQETVMFIS